MARVLSYQADRLMHRDTSNHLYQVGVVATGDPLALVYVGQKGLSVFIVCCHLQQFHNNRRRSTLLGQLLAGGEAADRSLEDITKCSFAETSVNDHQRGVDLPLINFDHGVTITATIVQLGLWPTVALVNAWLMDVRMYS